MHDKKLTAVGVGTCIGHSNGSGRVFAFEGLIGKFITGSAGSVAFRISALDHKTTDDSVKLGVIVKIGFGQREKIACGDGGFVSIQFNCDGSCRCGKNHLICDVRLNFEFGLALGSLGRHGGNNSSWCGAT